MIINLELARREYILRNNINDTETIASISLSFRGTDKLNRAVFDVYSKDNPTPLGWVLEKYDVSVFKNDDGLWEFPKGTPVTPLSVVAYINRRTGLGMVPSDIAFVSEMNTTQFQVMMDLDSMYFINSFMLKTV